MKSHQHGEHRAGSRNCCRGRQHPNRPDVAQASRILDHTSTTITLNVDTHRFDDARHTRELRERMATSAFTQLLGASTT